MKEIENKPGYTARLLEWDDQAKKKIAGIVMKYSGLDLVYDYPDVLYVLTTQDAQEIAQQKIGRDLSRKELKEAVKYLDEGLTCWSGVMEDAIDAIVKKKKKKRGDEK